MNHNGFSLVELSIVLVIVGLLVGGILAGKSLIRASELRAVSIEYDRHKTALHAFKDKYFGLPGDITNATSFWGIAAGTTGNDATCKAVYSTDIATCNGNGNGQIANPDAEQFRFWQQLANAGLIQGQFTGRDNGIDTDGHTPGTNCPQSKVGRAGWAVRYQTGVGPGQYHNTFMLGNPQPTYNDMPGIIFLKPEEAWNIDSKIDDGLPFSGKMVQNNSGWATCTTAPNSTTYSGDYLLTNNDVGCALKFIID